MEVIMKKIRTNFDKSNKGIVLVLIVFLLSLYGFTVSTFLASGPSQGFSREVEIIEATSGKQINLNSHVETILLSEDKVLIAAVDNHHYKLITISPLGTVLDENTLDLDLFNARDISASLNQEGILTLYYIEGDLFKVLIDLETMTCTKSIVSNDVDYFTREGQMIVFQKDSNLFFLNIENDERILPLLKGPIKSYAMTKDNKTGLYHLMTTIRNSIEVDIRYVQFNEQLTIENDFLLRESSANNRLQYISALHAADEILTAVFVWTDTIYGENNVTVHQYTTETAELITDYRHEFSSHRSRYIITDVIDDHVQMIFQENVHYGVNLVEVLMSSDKTRTIRPLTKTNKLSLLSKYFQFGEDQGLVFFDLVENEKIIYFASSNPELIEMTTKAWTINPLRIIGLIFMVIIQAAFTSAIFYIIFISIGPFLLLLLLNKFLADFKNKIYVQSGIAALIHTILKLFLTYHIIHVMGNYILKPPIIGEEPYIYVFMIFLSIFSFFLMSRNIKYHRDGDDRPIQSYLHFIFYDYVSYTLIVYIYIVTYLLIDMI